MAESRRAPREDVRLALAGRWPGRLLRGELVIDDGFVRELVGLTGEAVPWSARQAVVRRLQHDLVVTPFSTGWGSPVQPDGEEAAYLLQQWRAESDLCVLALMDGPFSAAAKALGWEGALTRLSAAGRAEQNLMGEATLELAEQARALAGLGADGIVIGDDIAYRRSTYIDPARLRASYFPFLTLLIESIHQIGLPVVFHSDGNLWAVLDDLLAAGIDGLQGMEPGAGMSLAGVREKAGPDLCLWGNVDVGWLAQPLTPDEIADHVTQLLQSLAGTPVILGASGGLMAGLPGANVEAMLRAR